MHNAMYPQFVIRCARTFKDFLIRLHSIHATIAIPLNDKGVVTLV